MKIIPVIDVLNGTVVHAVRGNRDQYKPVKSNLSSSADALEIASMFRACGFEELYLADLDAITGNESNFSLYSLISEKTELELMVDAGVADIEKAEKVLATGVSKVVIGTETLKDLKFVKDALKRFGSNRIVVSLDLFGNKVLGKFFQCNLHPLVLLGEFEDNGVEQVIILDLARVGSGEGVNSQLLEAASASSNLKLFAGGGVRDMKDLLELKRIGVTGVLMATALHSGKISVDDLRLLGFLH